LKKLVEYLVVPEGNEFRCLRERTSRSANRLMPPISRAFALLSQNGPGGTRTEMRAASLSQLTPADVASAAQIIRQADVGAIGPAHSLRGVPNRLRVSL
jgi:hypothetical protein